MYVETLLEWKNVLHSYNKNMLRECSINSYNKKAKIVDIILHMMQVPRTEWVLKWPGQVVIAGCQTFWTAEVSAALQDGDISDLYQNLLGQVCIIYTLREDSVERGRERGFLSLFSWQVW